MAVAVLVIFWVVVGFGVFLVAMRATRKPQTGRREPKAVGRAYAFGLVAIFIVLGIAVPAIVLVTNTDANEHTKGGVDLTSAQVHGRELFAHNCSTCHTLAASNAVGKVGPNFDQLRPNEALVLNAIANGRARGMGQMPAGLLSGQDARDVASYVAAVAGH